jgi:hypothetical protein
VKEEWLNALHCAALVYFRKAAYMPEALNSECVYRQPRLATLELIEHDAAQLHSVLKAIILYFLSIFYF